jgi:hypothetical protein
MFGFPAKIKAFMAIFAVLAALVLPRIAIAAPDHGLCKSECSMCEIAAPGACAACVAQCQPLLKAEAENARVLRRGAWPLPRSAAPDGLDPAPPKPPPRSRFS